MAFVAGLLPGLLLGVAIGLVGTVIVRHSRPLLKALVKGGVLVADGLGIVWGKLRAQFGALVAEARSELARPSGAGSQASAWSKDETEPPAPAGRLGGPYS